MLYYQNQLYQNKKIDIQEAEDTQAYQIAKERVEIIRLISSDTKTVVEAITKLNGLFSDDNSDGIQLSTIHRSKGLEADRVIIIHEELMPSKYAKTMDEKEQERNLIYVAYTRAKKLLGFCYDFDAYKSKQDTCKSSDEPIVQYVAEKGQSFTGIFRIDDIKYITTKFGRTQKYIMKDIEGRVISKIGYLGVSGAVSGKSVEITADVKDNTRINDTYESLIGKISSIKFV